MLSLFAKDPKARAILHDVKTGKSHLSIPIVVYAESVRKLLQRGVAKDPINEFFDGVESSIKVQISQLDKSIVYEGALLSVSYGLSLIDAFVAASAKLYKCDVLLAADTDYAVLVKKNYIKIQNWD